jgi:hypothetical protein
MKRRMSKKTIARIATADLGILLCRAGSTAPLRGQ